MHASGPSCLPLSALASAGVTAFPALAAVNSVVIEHIAGEMAGFGALISIAEGLVISNNSMTALTGLGRLAAITGAQTGQNIDNRVHVIYRGMLYQSIDGAYHTADEGAGEAMGCTCPHRLWPSTQCVHDLDSSSSTVDVDRVFVHCARNPPNAFHIRRVSAEPPLIPPRLSLCL